MCGTVISVFASGGMVDAETRNNEVFMLISFPLLSILYIIPRKYAITEQSRFEYSSDMNCLRNVLQRLHIADNGDRTVNGEKCTVRIFIVPFRCFCII